MQGFHLQAGHTFLHSAHLSLSPRAPLGTPNHWELSLSTEQGVSLKHSQVWTKHLLQIIYLYD